jgi:cardiolipin synthase A/B
MIAGLAGGLLLLYIGLVSPKRALRCLPAAGRYFSRAYSIQRASLPGVIPGNQLQLLVNGDEALPVMLALIDSATSSVRIQTMLFFPDEAGMSVARALARAAERGVRVQLSFNIDQTASGTLADRYTKEKKARLSLQMDRMIEELRDGGVELRDNPPGIEFELEGVSPTARSIQQEIERYACVSANHYDHRKLLIVDDNRAIIGGMNIGNSYLYRVAPDLHLDMLEEAAQREAEGKPEAWEKWFDAALLVEGPAARAMVDEFNWRWEVLKGEPIPPSLPDPASSEGERPGVDLHFLVQRPGRTEVGTAFMDLVGQARLEIYVSSPFVSYEPALQALQAAARRGVRVVFVVPNERQEVTVSGRVMRAAAPDLVHSGLELYYNDLRMAHTKILVVDGEQVLLGSFNLNHRSFRHDLETAVLVRDSAFSQDVIERVFNPYLSISHRVTAEERQPLNLLDWFIKPFT